ncbi:16S rRNA (guanine(966)-N(2))-methyltransferase RsmD [Litorivivens sp.]
MGRHQRTPANKAQHDYGTVRIIAGQWRGRKLRFPATDGLRPTGDRLRETLFNWLAPHIEGARCLDAFAGSGALGLEALSRGAAHCHFVDNQRAATDALRDNLSTLTCNNAKVVQASVLDWLARCDDSFDIIFVDPPFSSGLYEPILTALAESATLRQNGLLYIESDRKNTLPTPPGFTVLKDKTAGNARYQLWQKHQHP